MEKLKVIFRKTKNPYTKENEIIAFFPEISANYGNIMSYMHIGQSGEASMEFYWNTTKAKKEEYESLFNELKEIYNEYELVVRQRVTYDDLSNKAWKYN